MQLQKVHDYVVLYGIAPLCRIAIIMGRKNNQCPSDTNYQCVYRRLTPESGDRDTRTFAYREGERLKTEPIESGAMSVREMAKYLGIGLNTAYTMIHSPGFPVVRIAKRVVIPKALLDKWLEEQVGKDGAV